jgi:hypothetical protein
MTLLIATLRYAKASGSGAKSVAAAKAGGAFLRICRFASLHHQLYADETTDAASSRSAAKRLYAVVYWLMLDNITFATSLMAAAPRGRKDSHVAAVAAAAAADNAASKQKKDEHQFRKRASSFIVK